MPNTLTTLRNIRSWSSKSIPSSTWLHVISSITSTKIPIPTSISSKVYNYWIMDKVSAITTSNILRWFKTNILKQETFPSVSTGTTWVYSIKLSLTMAMTNERSCFGPMNWKDRIIRSLMILILSLQLTIVLILRSCWFQVWILWWRRLLEVILVSLMLTS